MSIFSLLGGFGKAAMRDQEQKLQRTTKERHDIVNMYMQMASMPNIDPQSIPVLMQKALGVATTPIEKKLPKELQPSDDLFLLNPIKEKAGETVGPTGQIQPMTVPKPPIPFGTVAFRSPQEMADEKIGIEKRAIQELGPAQATAAGQKAEAVSTATAPYDVAVRMAGMRPPVPKAAKNITLKNGSIVPAREQPDGTFIDPSGNVIPPDQISRIGEGRQEPVGTENERLAALYAKKMRGEATPEEEIEMKAIEKARTQRQVFNFNMQNPPPGDVGWKADQIQRDFTVYQALTAGNKREKAAVDAELSRRGEDVNKITSTTRQLAETSKTLIPKIEKVVKRLDEPQMAAKLGPAIGRWQEFMAGKVGIGDPDFAWLRTQIGLIQTGIMRAHVGARGGQLLLGHFKSFMAADRMDSATLKASLSAAAEFLTGYKESVFGPDKTPKPIASPPGTKDLKGMSDAELMKAISDAN